MTTPRGAVAGTAVVGIPPFPPSSYTDGTYLARNPTWHTEHSAWKARHILRMLDRNAVRPRTICEVGCGGGEILRTLTDATDESVRLVGYDISPQALALAREKASARLSFRLGSVPECPDGPFDLVLLIDLVEHLEDYYGFLRAIGPTARRVVLHVPLELSAQAAIRQGFFTAVRESAGHLHYFTRSTILATLAQTGYDVADYDYTASALEFPPSSLKMRAARWPRRLVSRLDRDLAARLLGGFSLLVLARSRAGTGR